MSILRKYGVEATFNFDLFEVDGVDFRVDAAHASGDTKVMKDEGAEANTTNGFTDEGSGYSIVLTATEMQAARIVIYAVDQTATKVWLDRTIIIETYGHASAEHAFDLDTASVAQTGDSFARLGSPAGASVSADVADVPTVSEFNARTIVAANYALEATLGTPAVDVATDIANQNDVSPAEVNAEVVDVMEVDTITLPGQEGLTVSPTRTFALAFLYKFFRNRLTQTATEAKLYADNGTTVDQKGTVSDDTVTFDRGELGSGP